MYLPSCMAHHLVFKHGNGKSRINGGSNRKITYKWSIFHCHVWLPEGKRLIYGWAKTMNTRTMTSGTCGTSTPARWESQGGAPVRNRSVGLYMAKTKSPQGLFYRYTIHLPIHLYPWYIHHIPIHLRWLMFTKIHITFNNGTTLAALHLCFMVSW